MGQRPPFRCPPPAPGTALEMPADIPQLWSVDHAERFCQNCRFGNYSGCYHPSAPRSVVSGQCMKHHEVRLRDDLCGVVGAWWQKYDPPRPSQAALDLIEAEQARERRRALTVKALLLLGLLAAVASCAWYAIQGDA